MSQVPPTAILFDFDGTIAHSLGQWLQAYKVTLESYGVKSSAEEIKERCFYQAFEVITERYGLDSPAEFESRIWNNLSKLTSFVELFPGVLPSLNSLLARNSKLAIVTSSKRNVVIETLKNLKADSIFHHLVTADEVKNLKPDPEPIFLALELLGTSVEDAVYIGDSHVDMIAGKNAGIRTGLFLPELNKQYYSFEVLRSHQPDFEFSHHAELDKHLFFN